jgi:hypothetical protein
MTEVFMKDDRAGAAEEPRFEVGSWERPDPAGIVRRGGAVGLRDEIQENGALPCKVGACEQPSVMEVYGLYFCKVHGEECAAGVMEEIAYDLEQELERPINPHLRSLSPHLEAALHRGFGVLPEGEAHADRERADGLLLAAWPLDRGRTDTETLAYVQEPEPMGLRDHDPPYDSFLMDRMLVHRLMRLAFEEDASWLVEALEPEREQVSAQAAYALALQIEAGLVPPRQSNDKEAQCT